MDDAKKQIVDIIRNNANILVTVSNNPSVDELSAALGLTILLDSLDKRATAVFSGTIPPAISFLEPDKTFENTADSLRDFIIALDKEKADHLRYKVEGDVVKIFITPYKTTLTQKDLDFSQGDYNVEVVLALGVKDQDHLDKALEAHGKILHDATVLTITAGSDTSNLGSLDWHDGAASSLSEMIVSLADGLKDDKPLLDEQISTALLTGIVSATDRFSNDHTSSRAMTVAAQLMAAGANQQLIAAKLEEAHEIAPGPVVDTRKQATEEAPKPKEPTTELSINRSERNQKKESEPAADEPAPELDFELTGDVKQEPTGEEQKPAEDTSTSDEASAEVKSQAELEQQLAGLMPPTSGATMADIENQLKEASSEVSNTPSDTPDDTATPTGEPEAPQEPSLPELTELPAAETPQPVTEPAPLEPELPPLDQSPPQIINEHGAFSETPPVTDAPINSIQNNPHDGEATIDPFAFGTSGGVPSLPPLTPEASEGTPEGAAILASEPTSAPVSDQPAVEIPQLPPLPPLPPEVAAQVPLPPPPPLPSFDPSPTTNASGAVSGDVFGDGNSAAAQPAAAPSEPGQFKIPGQG